MTQWGIDTLFNPGKRHMDEEKRRLQSTREEIGDSSGGKRIDLESGKVRLTGSPGKDEADKDEAGNDEAGKDKVGTDEAGNDEVDAASDETQQDEAVEVKPVAADEDDSPAARARRRRRNAAG